MSLPNLPTIGPLCDAVVEALLHFPSSNDQKAVDETRQNIVGEVQSLQKFADLIERVHRAQSQQQQTSSTAEEEHWYALHCLLARCRRTLSSLRQSFAIRPESKDYELHYNEPWKISPSLLLVEHKQPAASVGTLRAHINLYTETLQMSLQAINLVHQKRNQTSPETLHSHMQSIEKAFSDLNMVLTRRWSLIDRDSEANIVLDDALVSDVQRCYTSAKSITQTATMPVSPSPSSTPQVVFGTPDFARPAPPHSERAGVAESPIIKERDDAPFRVKDPQSQEEALTERGSLQMNEHLDVLPLHRDSCTVEPLSIRRKPITRNDQTGLPKILTEILPNKDNPLVNINAKHQGSPDSGEDPEPDFGEPDFPPAVYAELVATLEDEVHREMMVGNYEKAEIAHLKAMHYLTNREVALKISYDHERKVQMDEILAEIYFKRQQHEKAKEILSRLLKQEKPDGDRKWRLYHMLAGVYLEQKRLPEAEKYAKRAYVGRETTFGKGHGLILESAAQLVQIYEAKGEKDTAQAFRNLYDSSALQRNQAPQISKHIGTKRVKWNPDISVDINALQKNGETPLITAVTCGDDEMLQRVLQAGAGLEVRGPDGMTPLMHAIWHGHLKIAGVLLSRGAQVDAPTAGWTPLHKAADMGDLDMINLLLQYHADIEAKSPKKMIIRKQQQSSPRSSATNPTSHPPSSSYPSDDADSDDDNDSDNSSTAQGWTPLLRAAHMGNEPVVRRLLDRNADIEARSPSHATPLICAAEAQHIAVVDLLLLRGAQVEAEDSFGWKPLHRTLVAANNNNKNNNNRARSSYSGNSSSNDNSSSEAVAQRLIDHEADLNSVDHYRKTPLHHAVEKNNEAMACFLLRAGANIEARDVAQRTPLFTAIECRLENMVFILLEFGADAFVRDKAGRDALGAANHALRKSPEIVKLLGKHKKAGLGQRGGGGVGGSAAGSGGGGGSLSGASSSGGAGWRASNALSTTSTLVSSNGGTTSIDLASPRPESTSTSTSSGTGASWFIWRSGKSRSKR